MASMISDQICWRARRATAERDKDAPDIDINRACWPGLSAEQVRISKPQELAYRFQGHTHYLALHDIVRTDGETIIDGFARSVRRDIRGTLTFVPKCASVEGWSKYKDRPSSMFAIFLDPNADERDELRADDLPPSLYFENAPLKQTMQKLNAVMSSSLAHEQTYAEHLSLIILSELRHALLERQETPAVRGGVTPRQLNRIRDYITAQLDKDISLSELAGLINLSKFHFTRAFNKTTGMAPYQFVLSCRVERAKELLTEPNSSIAPVARSVGFHNTLQLDRAFRRFIGMTPSSYRDQVADNQSKFRRQEPANASNLRAHPEGLDSLRDICCETPQRDADHGETNECTDGAGKMFEVASQAAIAADPRKGPVDNPSLRQDLEASSGWSLAAPSGHGQLPKDYHAGKYRLPKEASFCVSCGLCVRYCALIKQKNAVGFFNRGPTREINFIPEIASEVCWDCKECFPLCPTSTLQEAFDLMLKNLSDVQK
jgi:AraC family transcriptional regulator